MRRRVDEASRDEKIAENFENEEDRIHVRNLIAVGSAVPDQNTVGPTVNYRGISLVR